MAKLGSRINYWLAEHPVIVRFRWSHAQSWGSTWPFLVSSIALYLLLNLSLALLLRLLRRRRPVPLGPIPALHSLLMAAVSAVIFAGAAASAAAEIRDTRWLWRRSRISTPLHWLLCFPIGTRPSGRVFFWSYAFYLSRFLHLLRSFFSLLRRRRHATAAAFRHSALVCMSFLWLEFSQSFQVVAILSATATHMVIFGYRFWVGVGLPIGGGRSCFPLMIRCQLALLGFNLVAHAGVLLLHLCKGGCNGIGAWVFNSVLNGALLLVFLNCYSKGSRCSNDDDCCRVHRHRRPPEQLEMKKEQSKIQ